MKTIDNYYRITPPKGLVSLNLPEIWRFKELLYILVWRDIKVRYKQTLLGIVWAIFQPVLTMVIFTLFFGRFVKIPSDGAPYPIFVYSGLLLWNYYASALTSSSNSLIENENIVKKVYFPRLILPLSTTLTPMVDFAVSFAVLLVLTLIYRFNPGPWGIVLMPLLLLSAAISASGLGLLFAAVNAKFRDVRYVLPFFIQILLFVTPVIYPVSIIPKEYQWVAFINPMAGVISLARGLLIKTPLPDTNLLLISLASSVIVFLVGLAYFRKTERFFADVL